MPSKTAQLEAARATIVHAWGRIDGLVNAAGGSVFGRFLTEQNRQLLIAPDSRPTKRAQQFIAHTPFQRFGEPEELAGTLRYLLSDASRFVTCSAMPRAS